MCYAIPGKIVEIKNNGSKDIAVVDYFGERKNVLNEFNDVKIGDYVYAQGGIIIDKISESAAQEILIFWKDRFFELKEIDKALSSIKKTENETKKLSSFNFSGILQKINSNKELTKEELQNLLMLEEKEELELLYKTANNLRQKENDNACCVHGIIEFSNYCRNNCFYCGIRNDRKEIERYRLEVEEIINIAKKAVNDFGFKALVLQSGEDFYYDEEKLIKIVAEVRKLGVLVFLSLGQRKKELYQKLFDAGARAVLLRFETSNKEIFNRLRPGTNFQERIQLIKDLKEIGFIITTGFLIGLPEENNEDIINNILLTKSLGADMHSFGPFLPAAETPLADCTKLSKDFVLKIIAITRLIDRQSKILVTTALETLNQDAKKEGLLAGANSIMINITPKNYADLYRIYDNKSGINNDINKTIKDTLELLYSIGRAPTDLGLYN